MSQVKVLVVEDEFIIASDISLRLAELGYDIVDIIDDVDTAIEFLEKQDVDLVLLDISLSGEKTGIDLAKVINESFDLPFIFLTSNSDKETLEEAKKLNPSAYLLKPFNHKQVSTSIDMALYNYCNKNSQRSKDSYDTEKQDVLGNPNSFFLRKGVQYEKVLFDDILWLEAESNYTYIHTKTEKYTYSTVLKKFECKLPSSNFIRVHRSYIVNMNNITGIDGNMLVINKKKIPISKSVKDEVFKFIEIV